MPSNNPIPVITSAVPPPHLTTQWSATSAAYSSRSAQEASDGAILRLAKEGNADANVMHCASVQITTDRGFYTAVAVATPAKATQTFLDSLRANEAQE